MSLNEERAGDTCLKSGPQPSTVLYVGKEAPQRQLSRFKGDCFIKTHTELHRCGAEVKMKVEYEDE